MCRLLSGPVIFLSFSLVRSDMNVYHSLSRSSDSRHWTLLDSGSDRFHDHDYVGGARRCFLSPCCPSQGLLAINCDELFEDCIVNSRVPSAACVEQFVAGYQAAFLLAVCGVDDTVVHGLTSMLLRQPGHIEFVAVSCCCSSRRPVPEQCFWCFCSVSVDGSVAATHREHEAHVWCLGLA